MSDSIKELRAECNHIIGIMNRSVYRRWRFGPIIKPDIPFDIVNHLLQSCDRVFKEHDKT